MKLIIQIPCYNEEETLKITVGDLPRHIEGIDEIEYLIINDGSSDNTVQAAKECGVHHIVEFSRNKGLAKAFLAGIDASLRLGADIIVNTDADNQYCGLDIEKLVKPILLNQADMVIGERPIMETEHFSLLKKILQRLGSLAVRIASGTDVSDAPSGFRAFSRNCAMRMNVVSKYSYTLETIIQAGRKNIAVVSVPIQTNPQLRESRLFSSMWQYVFKSVNTIVRIFLFYKPARFLFSIGAFFLAIGGITFVRFIFLVYVFERDMTRTYLPSIVFGSACFVAAILFFVSGFLGDILSNLRELDEEILYKLKKIEYEEKDNGTK